MWEAIIPKQIHLKKWTIQCSVGDTRKNNSSIITESLLWIKLCISKTEWFWIIKSWNTIYNINRNSNILHLKLCKIYMNKELKGRYTISFSMAVTYVTIFLPSILIIFFISPELLTRYLKMNYCRYNKTD